jgi:hypothetical protein
LKQEPTNKLHVDAGVMDDQSDINTAHLCNGEMENCSYDDAIIGNNLEEDPLDSDILTLHEEKK